MSVTGLPNEGERFEFVKELGRGGQGCVYLVRDLKTKELVALKTQLPGVHVSDNARDRFLREINTIQLLHHQNIVGFKQAGYANGAFFFVTEYCDGGSVDDLVARNGAAVSPDVAVPVILQALEGLAYAHQAFVGADASGFVHRDIKPSNILLLGSGPDIVAKIGDFGLAKAFDRAGLSGVSVSGTLAGTVPFMARKQLLNFKYSKPDVDIWSMAATLYWMLTARAPRNVLPGTDPIQAIVDQKALPIRHRNPRIPARLAEVVDTALLDEPGAGLTTAEGLARALANAM